MALTSTVAKSKFSKPIHTCELNKEELYKLAQKLQSFADSALKSELEHLRPKEDATQEDQDKYNNAKPLLEEKFILRFSIQGERGEDLYGKLDEVFNSPNFPERIKSFYVGSANLLKNQNYYPLNSFTVFIDFTKPAVFDFSVMPSVATPNSSNFEVEGFNTEWVNGVCVEIEQYLKEHSILFSVVHQGFIYDALLWLVGFPFSFWLCFKSQEKLNALFIDSVFIKSAAYLYIALFGLYLFRTIFHYSRWVFPKINYHSKYNKSLQHRLVLSTLFIGVFGTFITDVIKSI